MNIFYLDSDPIRAAEYCCDKHVVKMTLESAQLLCTAHAVLDGNVARKGYFLKPTHINHPSALWVRQSRTHYEWLYEHLRGLCSEYTRRYGKVYKIEREGLLEVLSTPPENLLDTGFTEPPQCMVNFCQVEGDAVAAYRNYYLREKARFAKWKLGNEPEWWNKVPD